jgi:hypothetical protein
MMTIKFTSSDNHIITYQQYPNPPYGKWKWLNSRGDLVDEGIARGLEGLFLKFPMLQTPNWKRI